LTDVAYAGLSMKEYPQIKRFVRDALGCACPDQVFRRIVCEAADNGQGAKIEIGGRLLIYLIDVDPAPWRIDEIAAALQRGVAERDRRGFNRFRLLLVTSRPERLSSTACRALENSPYRDDRAHLHVVDAVTVSPFFPLPKNDA
jgi:hypothetical protein